MSHNNIFGSGQQHKSDNLTNKIGSVQTQQQSKYQPQAKQTSPVQKASPVYGDYQNYANNMNPPPQPTQKQPASYEEWQASQQQPQYQAQQQVQHQQQQENYGNQQMSYKNGGNPEYQNEQAHYEPQDDYQNYPPYQGGQQQQYEDNQSQASQIYSQQQSQQAQAQLAYHKQAAVKNGSSNIFNTDLQQQGQGNDGRRVLLNKKNQDTQIKGYGSFYQQTNQGQFVGIPKVSQKPRGQQTNFNI